MKVRSATVALALTVTLVGAPAMAYVGPGAGLSLLSALWGLIAAVFLAIGFVVMWPFKRWLKRRRGGDVASLDGPEPGARSSQPPGWTED